MKIHTCVSGEARSNLYLVKSGAATRGRQKRTSTHECLLLFFHSLLHTDVFQHWVEDNMS